MSSIPHKLNSKQGLLPSKREILPKNKEVGSLWRLRVLKEYASKIRNE